MADDCCSSPSAGSQVCELPSLTVAQKPRVEAKCPQCQQKGKMVQAQTVKALVSDSLRTVRNEQYFFCRTETCAVVYYTANGDSAYTTAQLRERLYQKEPKAAGVPVCYCFQHAAQDVRNATPDVRQTILDDIKTGIKADQCACDLRNPQGSCCLGNVERLIRETSGAAPQK